MPNGSTIPSYPEAVLDNSSEGPLLMSSGSRLLLIAATGLVLASCAAGTQIEYRDCWTPALRDAGARCGLIVVPGSYSDPTRASRRVAFALKPQCRMRIGEFIDGPGPRWSASTRAEPRSLTDQTTPHAGCQPLAGACVTSS